jgi:hypothetical protein
MIEQLASLPPVQRARPDHPKIWHRSVAEVTGRSRRIVRRTGRDGIDRLAVENRARLGQSRRDAGLHG